MTNNAISVANEFIKLAKIDNVTDLTFVKLRNLVYIAYGFGLSLFDGKKSMIDPRFDAVEAWKYGPVIPSVYHTFKQNQNKNIEEEGILFSKMENDIPTIDYPELKDNEAKSIVNIVWRRYGKMKAYELMRLTHMKGTPWSISYIEGKNCKIPEVITKLYYDSVINMIIENNDNNSNSNN